jgi:hypothetical protein
MTAQLNMLDTLRTFHDLAAPVKCMLALLAIVYSLP